MKRCLALILCMVLVFIAGCSNAQNSTGSSKPTSSAPTVSLDDSMTWAKWQGMYLETLEGLAKDHPDALAVAYGYLLDEAQLEKLLGDKMTLEEWEREFGYLLEANFVSALFVDSDTTYEEWKKMYGYNFRNDADSAANSTPPAAPENQDASKHPTVYTPWQAVPLVTAEMVNKGYTGGEGCQWPLYITTSATDPNLAFMGTDVGGMYRTLDGGENWAMATVGVYSSAATGIAIDPKNADRVICVGVNSTYWPVNGLYLSTDKGDEWQAVYTYGLTKDENAKICGHRDFRHQVAFDESSYDKELGYCTTVYWCKETKKYGKGESTAACLFKSTDGGSTWKAVNTSEEIGGAEVFVSPAKGYVYIANKNGVFRSVDGGVSFKKVLDVTALGMDVISTRKNNVYVSANEGFYISEDNGDTFKKVNRSSYPTTYPARVRVSPVDPDRMMLQDDHLSAGLGYSSVNYYSHDGGKTWKTSVTDSSDAFIPYNIRQTVFAWNCKDADLCISTGGDMIMRSTNGGAKFVWGGNGYNGACISSLTFNVNNANLIVTGNQDYNGAYSTDAGKTWTYINWSGNEWGGFTYGGYAVDEQHIVALIAGGWSGTRSIAYTTDGGNTVVKTGIEVATGSRVYGAYGKNDIVFAGGYRSTDKGINWAQMSGCKSVYCHSTADASLYGVNDDGNIVRSDDYGISWTVIGSVPEGVKFMTFDQDASRLVVLAQHNKVYTLSPKGGTAKLLYNFSSMRDVTGDTMDIRCVAVDPENSDVIYVSSARGVYASGTAVLRSVDGGLTWVNLSRNPGDGSQGTDGGRDINNILINPLTRELFTVGGCRGMYKMKLPD